MIQMSDEQSNIWDTVSEYDPRQTVAKAIAEALAAGLAPKVLARGLEMSSEEFAAEFKALLAQAPKGLKIPGIDAKFVERNFSHEALVAAYKKAKDTGEGDYTIMSLIGMVRNGIVSRLSKRNKGEATPLLFKFNYLVEDFMGIYKEAATTFAQLSKRMNAVYSGSANKIINAFASNSGRISDRERLGVVYGVALTSAVHKAVTSILKQMWNDSPGSDSK